MRGVAYDATLYDYKTDNNGDPTLEAISTDASTAAIFNQHVTDGIQVSNNSWGSNIKITNTTASAIRSAYPSTINAMRSAQSNGTLIIFAAGNDGWLQPNADAAAAHLITELANEWLVVVAVDSTLTETNYTNRCGVAYNICVTAPGGGDNAADGILSAQANGTYVRSSGTSMAAPHVSGLAAALMEKFPSLTAAQIATRIKSTASYSTLTGSSGQTSANSSAATMQAIFGYGLVNSGRAAAAIGSYVYATGSNLNNGQNLSMNKLVLPAGLPASTQNKILESNFIVFDSFDGARFSVTGKEVFNSTRSSIARTYDTAKIIDKQNNTNIGFTASGQKNAPSKWAPRFIKSGSSSDMTAADGFWGKSASMFASQPFIKGQPSTNFVWAQTYGDLAIQPFIQVQDISASSQSIGSYGASIHLDLYEGLKAVTGYKISDHVLNNGILPDLASTGSSRDFEVGFLKNISSTENLFLRFSDTQIENLAATDKTFGFRGVKANSWTAGYETQSSLGDFTFGVSRPSQLSSGTISLITPTGRTRSGDVLYKETVFDVSGDDRLERFVAYHYKKDELAISFGVTENRYNYGKVGAAKLDISMQF
jgi:subtilase-type serine protease